MGFGIAFFVFLSLRECPVVEVSKKHLQVERF